jgi:hypothetical protein
MRPALHAIKRREVRQSALGDKPCKIGNDLTFSGRGVFFNSKISNNKLKLSLGFLYKEDYRATVGLDGW